MGPSSATFLAILFAVRTIGPQPKSSLDNVPFANSSQPAREQEDMYLVRGRRTPRGNVLSVKSL